MDRSFVGRHVVGRVVGRLDEAADEMEAAFGYGTGLDELTEREIDALYVAEMERREWEEPDHPSLRPVVRDGSYPTYADVPIPCQGCGRAVMAQAEMNPTVTCPDCWRRRAEAAPPAKCGGCGEASCPECDGIANPVGRGVRRSAVAAEGEEVGALAAR